jgi:hypothetical protein
LVEILAPELADLLAVAYVLTTVIELVTEPIGLEIVITTAQNPPLNPEKVAVPVPKDEGETVVPLRVNLVVVLEPIPPDHVKTNPVDDTLLAARPVIAVGGFTAKVILLDTDVNVFVAITTTVQEVPYGTEKVAVPVPDEVGVALTPPIV